MGCFVKSAVWIDAFSGQQLTRKLAKEKIVGFYSTGPNLRPADIEIEALFRKYTQHPVLVVIDVRPNCPGEPTQAYITEEIVKEVFATSHDRCFLMQCRRARKHNEHSSMCHQRSNRMVPKKWVWNTCFEM